jgi:molybdopterin synthase catalytic subunit
MRVQLLHFASFRETLGRDAESRNLPEGARVRDVWALLQAESPGLAQFASTPPAAVNRVHAAGETILRDGDEVAFLPPIAGG